MSPTVAALDTELSDKAHRVLTVLTGYGWTMGTDSFPMTGSQLGTLMRRHRNRIAEAVSELEDRGYIRVDRKRGMNRPNQFTLLHRIQGSRSTGNGSAGSTGNGASGCTEIGASSIDQDRQEETTSAAGSAGTVEFCGHCDYGWRQDDGVRGVYRCACVSPPPAF